MKTIILALFLSINLKAETLSALNGEWFGKCQNIVNEAGEIIDKKSSLQSSYSFHKEKGLIWKVSSFKDAKCGKLKDANRYTFKCDKKTTLCTQTKWESTKNGKKWTSNKMVDYAGYPSVSKMYVTLKKVKSNIQITTKSVDTEEPETQLLTP